MQGMVRFDYILEGQTFYLLEANTTPGMSEASIIPQQAKAYGWTIGKLLETIVNDCIANPH
jgi:D-alanine-D-alanine ligase